MTNYKFRMGLIFGILYSISLTACGGAGFRSLESTSTETPLVVPASYDAGSSVRSVVSDPQLDDRPLGPVSGVDLHLDIHVYWNHGISMNVDIINRGGAAAVGYGGEGCSITEKSTNRAMIDQVNALNGYRRLETFSYMRYNIAPQENNGGWGGVVATQTPVVGEEYSYECRLVFGPTRAPGRTTQPAYDQLSDLQIPVIARYEGTFKFTGSSIVVLSQREVRM